MVYSQVPNLHGIGSEDEDYRRSIGYSRNSEPSLPERIETERMSNDEALKIKRVLNNRLYRQRKKDKMDTLEAENKKLKGENEKLKSENCLSRSQIDFLKQEMQLLNLRLETQSKELGGLRKTCDRLEEKNAEERARNRRLKSKLKKLKEKIESLEQCMVNPTFESRSNEMPQQFVAPQVQSLVQPAAQVALENYTQFWENALSWLPEPEDYAPENHTQMQVAEDYPPMQVAPGNNTTGPVE